MANPKWQYLRDDVHSLDELDTKLGHWGTLGWELVTILYEREVEMLQGRDVLAPPTYSRTDTWSLILKQPLP